MTPIVLPLVGQCPASTSVSALDDSSSLTLQVQMNTLGGQVYHVPLTVVAAKALLVILASWPPVQDQLLGQETPEPPKLQ